ncbi:MAG: hypothetical protein QW774_01220 [Candidatus Micrarchaeaceae archaeon]
MSCFVNSFAKTVAYEPAGSEKLSIDSSPLFSYEKSLNFTKMGRSDPFMLSSGMLSILNISAFMPSASIAAFS